MEKIKLEIQEFIARVKAKDTKALAILGGGVAIIGGLTYYLVKGKRKWRV